MGQKSRKQALESLVLLNVPVEEAVAALQAYPWDCEQELVVLTPTHMLSVFNRFLSGELSPEDLHRWAESLESRDDLGLQAADQEVLQSMLFCLTTPEINEPISPELIVRLRDELANIAA